MRIKTCPYAKFPTAEESPLRSKTQIDLLNVFNSDGEKIFCTPPPDCKTNICIYGQVKKGVPQKN